MKLHIERNSLKAKKKELTEQEKNFILLYMDDNLWVKNLGENLEIIGTRQNLFSFLERASKDFDIEII